jgi:hypothetical protein
MKKASMTFDQGVSIVRLFEDGARWAMRVKKVEDELDKETAQRVIESGDKLRAGFPELILGIARGPYFDEQVESNYGYPQGWRLKGVSEQLAALQEIETFRSLDGSNVVQIADRFTELPEEADGLSVFPKPSKVANSYNEAVVLMTDLMKESRKDWYNYREGELGPEYLRLTQKTQQAITRLEQDTPGDYLVVPVQTGLWHRGRSVRRARAMMFQSEWGLGPYELGIILRVHPERLQKYEHLAIDCAGCEYSPGADAQFSHCLYFYWSGGVLEFDSRWSDCAYRHFGSASSFG